MKKFIGNDFVSLKCCNRAISWEDQNSEHCGAVAAS